MEKKQRFSLRKYKFGVASVLVGLSMVGGLASGQVAFASEETATQAPATSETTSQEDVVDNSVESTKGSESTKVEVPVETVASATELHLEASDSVAVTSPEAIDSERSEVQQTKTTEPTQSATLPEKEETTSFVSEAVPASSATSDAAYRSVPSSAVAVEDSASYIYTPVEANQSTVEPTQRAKDAISSISMEAVTSEQVKVTVKTKQPFQDISSAYIWNANTGQKGYSNEINDKDNYTFEFIANSLNPGHWKPLEFRLRNMSGNYVYFSQRDLLPFTTGVVIGGAKAEPNQAISLATGEDSAVVVNKRQAGTDEVVKYTIKIKDAYYPSVETFYLYNDSTGKTNYITSDSYLDDNNNAVVFVPTSELSKGVWKLYSFDYYLGTEDTRRKSIGRLHLYKSDNKTSLSIDKAIAEPNYIPDIGNKKAGVFTNLSQVEKGSRIVITVKSDLSLNNSSLYVVNSATGRSEYLYGPILDSNGNYVYYDSTSDYRPGDYTVESIGDLKAIDLNLDQAGFKVVEFGQNIRRTGNTATPTPQPTPRPTTKQGWSKVGNTWYYNKADGSRATNTWIQGKYYVKANGAMATNEWVKTGKAWYYTKADGSYATNTWIQGKYYVKANGAMAANEWVKAGKTWYYTKTDGSYAANTWIQGKYYVKANGAMATNEWVKAGNTWYYTKVDGSYATNTWIQGKYYVKANGAMATNEWVKVGKTWYYTKADGSYAANTWVQGKYYVKANGAMATNEWVKVGKTWYYTKADGSYAANTWVQGKYYVKANGAMATNEWIKVGNTWYYTKADGSYI